jgi:hypothetical protein
MLELLAPLLPFVLVFAGVGRVGELCLRAPVSRP